jgi:CrcB protein
MLKVLLVMLGGAVGSALRYGVVNLSSRLIPGFPSGTLLVNMIGSFVIGLLWGIAEAKNFSPSWRALLFAGLLGGFTTFSAYAIETLNLARDGSMRAAFLNFFLQNTGGFLLAFAGWWLARQFS